MSSWVFSNSTYPGSFAVFQVSFDSSWVHSIVVLRQGSSQLLTPRKNSAPKMSNAVNFRSLMEPIWPLLKIVSSNCHFGAIFSAENRQIARVNLYVLTSFRFLLFSEATKGRIGSINMSLNSADSLG